MAERGRATVRAALVVLLAILGVIQIQVLTLLAHGQARAAERFVAPLRATLMDAQPRLAERLAAAGPEASLTEARQLFAGVGPILLVDEGGRCLAALPTASCAPDPFLPNVSLRRRGAQERDVIVVGPTSGLAPRVLLYVPLAAGGERLYVRVGSDAASLAADSHERRQALLLHGVALVVVVLVGALVLLPDRSRREGDTAGAAMDAYEVAMERLQVRGSELSRSHAAEVHRLQETLRDREAMARAGELTSGIVHEVRNGLGTLSGYVRLLERTAAGSGGEAAELLAAMREECTTLEGVVRRIADFVRSEEMRPARFDIRRMLERVVARENRRPGPQAAVREGEPVSVVADEDLLERAFENLVRNAREAAGEGGSVVVEARSEAAEVVVRVSDDGPGLPAALDGGFRPFLTTKPGGLGLGLSMALKLVTLHGGELSLAALAPRGLQSTVRLPRCGEADGDTSGDRAGRGGGGPAGG